MVLLPFSVVVILPAVCTLAFSTRSSERLWPHVPYLTLEGKYRIFHGSPKCPRSLEFKSCYKSAFITKIVLNDRFCLSEAVFTNVFRLGEQISKDQFALLDPAFTFRMGERCLEKAGNCGLGRIFVLKSLLIGKIFARNATVQGAGKSTTLPSLGSFRLFQPVRSFNASIASIGGREEKLGIPTHQFKTRCKYLFLDSNCIFEGLPMPNRIFHSDGVSMISERNVFSVDLKPIMISRNFFPLVAVLVALVLGLLTRDKPNAPFRRIHRSQVHGDNPPKDKAISFPRRYTRLIKLYILQITSEYAPQRRLQNSNVYGAYRIALCGATGAFNRCRANFSSILTPKICTPLVPVTFSQWLQLENSIIDLERRNSLSDAPESLGRLYYLKDIDVVRTDPTSLLVLSGAGFVFFRQDKNSPGSFVITDGNISISSDNLSVSKIFDVVYDHFRDENGIKETLCRLILHTVAVAACEGENDCYSAFVKESTIYHGNTHMHCSESNPRWLFPFRLDLPISLSLLLQIFEIGLIDDAPFLKSRNFKIPFSYEDGKIHIGRQGRLRKSAFSVILHLKDDILVGAKRRTLTQEETLVQQNSLSSDPIRPMVCKAKIEAPGKDLDAVPVPSPSHFSNKITGGKSHMDSCRYIQALGLRKLDICNHEICGVEEIEIQMQRMGVPAGMISHILASKFTAQESDELTSTCDDIALKVAEYIRSLRSKFHQPIVLESERKGLLSRISKNKTIFLPQSGMRGALQSLRKNVTFAGKFELNAGVIRLETSAQETERESRRIPESLRLSEYVRAMVNRELTNRIIRLEKNIREEVWIDPENSAAFNAACLIAVWTLDQSIELVGAFRGIEEARWRTKDGLPKLEKCIADVPISQFVYTLDETEISELTPVSMSFLSFKECNIASDEEIFVGRNREKNGRKNQQ